MCALFVVLISYIAQNIMISVRLYDVRYAPHFMRIIGAVCVINAQFVLNMAHISYLHSMNQIKRIYAPFRKDCREDVLKSARIS